MPLASPACCGQLSIWTDVDPAHDSDFNRWYDREHLQERLAIPGFRRARRFRALSSSPRPYLALYDTENLQVFRSPAYRQALERQTGWSLRNFARMYGTQRRVGELSLDIGQGEGAALALFVIADVNRAPPDFTPRFEALVARDHVVRASLLRTDVALSAPLSASDGPARADRLVMVEATRHEAAFDAAMVLAQQLCGTDADEDDVHVFQALWTLRA